MFYRNITELVGKTPMMNLLNIEKNNNLQAMATLSFATHTLPTLPH